MTKNRVIGKNNKLPWYMPHDLAYFFKKTHGRHIIMGRKNFEANGKALPGRTNIVVTRKSGYQAPGCVVMSSIKDAFDYAQEKGETEVFVVGGGEIYRATLDETDRIYLTIIGTELEGDVYYPDLNPEEWCIVSEEKHPADEKNKYDFTYFVFERKT